MDPIPDVAPTTGGRRSLLFVDDDLDLQEIMRDTAELIGIDRILTFGSLAALKSSRSDALTCSMAILDINLGANTPSGIDVYNWLATERFEGPIVFLTGHGADDPRVQEAARIAALPILTKPIGIADLAALVASIGAR
jgi:DNA-binding response OmpR family regulator